MSRNALPLLLALFTCFFTSCIPSIQPFYTTDLLTTSDALAGDWVAEQSEASEGDLLLGTTINWKVKAMKDGSYRIRMETDGKAGWFVGYLFRAGDHLLLDTTPGEGPADEGLATCLDDMSEYHLLPLHHLWRVRFEGGRLHLDQLDPDWFEQALSTHQTDGLLHDTGDMQLFTASSEVLAAWLLRHADEQGFWEEALVLHPAG